MNVWIRLNANDAFPWHIHRIYFFWFGNKGTCFQPKSVSEYIHHSIFYCTNPSETFFFTLWMHSIIQTYSIIHIVQLFILNSDWKSNSGNSFTFRMFEFQMKSIRFTKFLLKPCSVNWIVDFFGFCFRCIGFVQR